MSSINSKLREIQLNNVEYQLFPYQFFLLTCWGIWTPPSWSMKAKRMHTIFFNVVFFFDTLICIEMLIYFVATLGTDDFRLINLFFLTATSTGVYKSIRFKGDQGTIRSFILSYLNHKCMTLEDDHEQEIHDKFQTKIKRVTIGYLSPMILMVSLKAISPLAEGGTVGVPLPVEAWYPYSMEKSVSFWFTYLHQVVLGASAVCSHIGIDTLFVGLLIKALLQMHLLRYRLEKIAKTQGKIQDTNNIEYWKNKKIMESIEHHERIYRYTEDIQSNFQEIVTIIAAISLPNICTTVYSLSLYTENIDVQYIATAFTLTSALIQFFMICWYGNELILNSIDISESVYNMDWTTFKNSHQKLLVTMMTRAFRPIQFNFGVIIPMNIDSFLKIIKASYTAFNLLQRTM